MNKKEAFNAIQQAGTANDLLSTWREIHTATSIAEANAIASNVEETSKKGHIGALFSTFYQKTASSYRKSLYKASIQNTLHVRSRMKQIGEQSDIRISTFMQWCQLHELALGARIAIDETNLSPSQFNRAELAGAIARIADLASTHQAGWRSAVPDGAQSGRINDLVQACLNVLQTNPLDGGSDISKLEMRLIGLIKDLHISMTHLSRVIRQGESSIPDMIPQSAAA